MTPVSASLIHDINANNTVLPKIEFQDASKVGNDESLLSIDNNINQLQFYSDSLRCDADYIKTRSMDYDWKIWKWPAITLDISKSIYKVLNTTNEVVTSVNNLKGDVGALECNDELYVNRQFDEEDEEYMAAELSKTMNTTFTAKKVNASEVKKGDIVQYMSQGKYPRYLEVVDIKKANNNTGRQLLEYTLPIDMNCFVLKGTGDKLVEEICINKQMELISSPVNAQNALQRSVQVQQNQIKQIQKNAANANSTAQKLGTCSKACGGATLFFSGAAVGVVILGARGGPLGAVATAIIGGISAAISVVLEVVTMELGTKSDSYENSADRLTRQAQLYEDDLANYTQLGDKAVTNMEVSTFDGIPIIKQPPISDWRELQAVIVENPKHGDLLMGSWITISIWTI